MRTFNVTGLCIPNKHYMVDISGKLEKIMEMIDRGEYFTINRARQYGKSTTLFLLAKSLPEEYTSISLSFEGVGETMFTSSASFCQRFLLHVSKTLEKSEKEKDKNKDKDKSFAALWLDDTVIDFDLLGYHIDKLCKGKKIVLMIDEVDKTSNNRIFLHFLGLLRSMYLANQAGASNAFHSVILAGVHDIRNIKLKMINEGSYTPAIGENQLFNSPWNIASDFNVDMSFNPCEITTMLAEYEKDHSTGMDIHSVADEIYKYTSGYPFLVSRLSQYIDSRSNQSWTIHGVQEAVQIILREKNTLFDDMIKNLINNKNLYSFLYNILFIGMKYEFNIYDPIIALGAMYGFISSDEHNKVRVTNKIFEICIYDFIVSKEATSGKRINGVLQGDVTSGGRFNMELCLIKFAEHYTEIFNARDAGFIEREGRLLFLSYLKPLINGRGYYHMESQFTDLRRMDIVVDYAREQFIIELKLWKGEAEHDKAYEQLAGYMGSKGFAEGYLLTFDFRKGVNKQPYAKWVEYNGIRIFDVVV